MIRIQTQYRLSIANDGVAILPRFPARKCDHVGGLVGTQSSLNGLARENNANLSREVAWILTIANINDRHVVVQLNIRIFCEPVSILLLTE